MLKVKCICCVFFSVNVRYYLLRQFVILIEASFLYSSHTSQTSCKCLDLVSKARVVSHYLMLVMYSRSKAPISL